MQRIAVFGGAFDPPHNGHLATIGKLVNSGDFSRVLVVPSGDRPDKTERARAAERLHMVKLVVGDLFPNDSRVEVFAGQALGEVGYRTVDLYDYLVKEYPGASLEFVIGSDLLAELPEWREVERLKKFQFVTLVRPGIVESALADRIAEGFTIRELNHDSRLGVMISSSLLRKELQTNRSTAGFLPSVVGEYIKLRNLYA